MLSSTSTSSRSNPEELGERLCLINPHWLQCPNAIGMIMGDFKIFEPKEGRFNVWNQTFTEGDMEKRLSFILYFLAFLKLLKLITPGEIPQSMVLYARYQRLMELLSLFLWLRRATSIATPMFFENLRKRSIPSDHAAVRVVIEKPTIRGHNGKCIPSWMPKHPVFCFILKQINDLHDNELHFASQTPAVRALHVSLFCHFWYKKDARPPSCLPCTRRHLPVFSTFLCMQRLMYKTTRLSNKISTENILLSSFQLNIVVPCTF